MREDVSTGSAPDPATIHSLKGFGAGLGGLRYMAGLTVRELAQQTEKYAPGKRCLTRSTISRLENGARLPSVEQLDSFLAECRVGVQRSREWRATRNRLDPAIARTKVTARDQPVSGQAAVGPAQSQATELVPLANSADSRPLFDCRCDGVKRSHPCSAGVWWNPVIQRCDWPHNVYKDLVTELGLDRMHLEPEFGHFPNSEDPRTWYHVDHYIGRLMNCSTLLWWNPVRNTCDWPESVYKDLMARWDLARGRELAVGKS